MKLVKKAPISIVLGQHWVFFFFTCSFCLTTLQVYGQATICLFPSFLHIHSIDLVFVISTLRRLSISSKNRFISKVSICILQRNCCMYKMHRYAFHVRLVPLEYTESLSHFEMRYRSHSYTHIKYVE